jgi:hypothetical protein
LVKAVRSDIYFGYIRDTLGHLTSRDCSWIKRGGTMALFSFWGLSLIPQPSSE